MLNDSAAEEEDREGARERSINQASGVRSRAVVNLRAAERVALGVLQ